MRGQATRTRLVELAALLSGGDVHLVDLDWTDEIERGCVQRSDEAQGTLVNCFVGDVDLSVKLLETRVESQNV